MPGTTEIDYKSLEVVKKVREEVAHVRWTVNNFTATYEAARGDLLGSNDFNIESNLFVLKLYCPEPGGDSFLFGLGQCCDEGERPIDIEANVWIEDLDGNKYFEVELSYSDRYENLVCHYFNDSFQIQDLGTKIKLRNDVAIICCEIKQYVPDEEIVLPKVNLKLLQKLWDSYQQGLTNGITIQVEDKELKVSKNILASNSDVFERMFLTEKCKELQEGIIKIEETSYDAMKAFVEYMHRGEVSNLSEVCDDLFVLAHKYLVVSLQKDCTNKMIESLTKENLFDRLRLAFLHEHKELKDVVLNYVTKPNSDLNFLQIQLSAEWHKLVSSNGLLANEITTAVYKKMKWCSEQNDDDEVPSKRQRMN